MGDARAPPGALVRLLDKGEGAKHPCARPERRRDELGLDVGIVETARRSSGPVPTAHSHFEPPASMPPKALTPCSAQRWTLNQVPPGPV